MERGKLEKYKDAPGVALMNAFSNGHLTRVEYKTIQKFKNESWDSIDEFLKGIEEEGAKTVPSSELEPKEEGTKIAPSEGTKIVDSTKMVPSSETAPEEGTKIVPSTIQERRVLKTLSNEAAAAEQTGLFNVNIKTNFTKVDNDIHTGLKPTQTAVEYSIYDTLYNRAVRWKRNHCRIGIQKLMKCCNISDKRRLNRGIDGLVEKKHIKIINRNNKGTLYIRNNSY